MRLLLICALTWIFPALGLTRDIRTNETFMTNAPKWLKQTRIEKVSDRIQTKLEWSTRRVSVSWYTDQKAFEGIHGLGKLPLAVTKYGQGKASIHMGPRVNNTNFDGIFGHELTHVILFQKYKGSVPKWLEEGLANHLAKKKPVDYKWLARQPLPSDVRSLSHPLSGSMENAGFRYRASQALAEMLERKCDLQNLIRLSVERKMEDYIKSYCEITDINATFKSWVKERAS